MNVISRFIYYANRLGGMIWVLARAFYRFRSVTTEASAAFRADDGRESFRFNRRESVNHDFFDPVGIVKAWMELLERIPVIVENLLKGVFVDAFHGCFLRTTITELVE